MTERISTHAQVFISLEFMPESTIVGLCDKCTLSFIKNCQTVFQCNDTIFILLSLLLLLSRFSHAQLCAMPQTAAHQAPPSLGFSRQEHWSGLPFPSPMHESEKNSEVAQSSLTPSDPMDCSPPGPSVHGIFQARALEWVPLPSPN